MSAVCMSVYTNAHDVQTFVHSLHTTFVLTLQRCWPKWQKSCNKVSSPCNSSFSPAISQQSNSLRWPWAPFPFKLSLNFIVTLDWAIIIKDKPSMVVFIPWFNYIIINRRKATAGGAAVQYSSFRHSLADIALALRKCITGCYDDELWDISKR